MKTFKIIIFIFLIILNVSAQYYGGNFKSREIYKKGYYTIKVYVTKRSNHKIRHISRLIIKILKEKKWKQTEDKNNANSILIYAGVNVNKYKIGKIKEGNSFVILIKGKDICIPIEKKKTKVYSSQIIKEIQKVM